MKLSWETCFRAGVTVAVLFLTVHYWSVIAAGIGIAFHAAAPLITGLVIAYAVNILMSFYERHYFPKSKKKVIKKTRTGVCVLLSYLSLLGIIALVIGLVVPELIDCVKLLIDKIPPLMQSVSGELRGNDEMTKLWNELGNVTKTGQIDWKEIVTKVANWAAGGLGGRYVFDGFYHYYEYYLFAVSSDGQRSSCPTGKKGGKDLFKRADIPQSKLCYTHSSRVFSQLYRGAVCRSCDFRKPVRYRYDDPASPLQWDDRGADRIYGIDPYRRSLYRRWHRLFDDRDSFADESNRICNFSCYFTAIGRPVHLSACGRGIHRTAGHLGAGRGNHRRKCTGNRRNAFIRSIDCDGI